MRQDYKAVQKTELNYVKNKNCTDVEREKEQKSNVGSS